MLKNAQNTRIRQLLVVDKRSGGLRPLSVAIVGLGHIAQSAVLPAFAQIRRYARIGALVSDDAHKLKALRRRYKVWQTYSYDGYDECLASGIDAVYIALPNDKHRDFAIKAAQAGIHVLCEKPMAMTSGDAAAMIDAAREAKTALMIGYRLHFDPANLHAVSIARSGKLGDLRYVHSTFSMQVAATGFRLDPHMGGGPLRDLGIYCINAARYLFQAEPIAALAMASRGADPRFAKIDEMISVMLRFPGDRHALFTASFGAYATSAFRLIGTRGSMRVDPAYDENTGACIHLDRGGRTSQRTFPDVDQFAAEIRYFAECISKRRDLTASGQEGLADLLAIEAIEESLRTGRLARVRSARRGTQRPSHRPSARQRIAIPLHIATERLVKTRPPERA
jgi:glucose-fructose oxidoreductase